MPYCSKCGNEISEEDTFCPNCGTNLTKPEVVGRPLGAAAEAGAIDHLTLGVRLATEKPMVFAPAVIGGIISIIISNVLSSLFWPSLWMGWLNPTFLLLTGLIAIVDAIIRSILNFASIDMSRDAYVNDPLNISRSLSYVLGRIVIVILASIIGAIMNVTIILIPIVTLMHVIIVVDETGIVDALSKAFEVLKRDLGDIIVLFLIAIVGSIVLGLVPYIGGLLTACFNVVVGLAFIDIYFQYKKQGAN